MNYRKLFHLTLVSLVAFAVFGIFYPAYAVESSDDPVQSGCRVNIIRSDETGFEMKIELLNIDISTVTDQGIEESRVIIPGESPGGQPGFPDLPHISRLIVVPPTAAVELVWNADQSRLVTTDPVTTVPSENERGDHSFITDIAVPELNDFFPEQVVEINPPVIMRSVRMVRVTVNPVQVNPATGEMRIWDNITVRLRYTDSDPVNPMIRPERARPSSTALRMIEALVVNPDDIRRDQDEGYGAYIYIVPNFEDEDERSVADVIAPLAKWRKQQGYPTEIITVDEHANNVDVKREILTAYEEWEVTPECVVLVGDADLANSDFMIATWDVGRAYMWETDYRYAMLAGDDLLPEVAVSRISARNLDELDMIVQDKILPYETDPHMENDDGEPEIEWFRRAALMANDQQTGYSSLYLQRWARALLLEVGFTEVDTMFFTDPGGHNQRREHDFIRDNINNEGINIFIYRGWGEFNGAWGVNDVRELRNGTKLPVMMLPTCNTGDFADHVMNVHAYTEDFLWGRRGGAIGAIGSSGFTHTNYNNVLTGGFINGLFRDKNWRLGWALNQAKIELYRHFGMYGDVDDPQVPSLKVWEAHCYQYNLIGDAGTEIWTDVPHIIEVLHPELLSVGENQLTLFVTDEETGDPISGATVTLLMEEELIRLEHTGRNGRIDFTFAQGELEAETILELTITKHDVKPYMAEIEIVAENVFVGVQGFLVDDDNAGRSRGNSNHIPNPGERIELRTFLANFGDEAADGELTVELDGIIGNVEIIQGEVNVDAPAMGDSVLATFLIDVNMASYDGQRLVFRVTVGNAWESAMELFVAAPNLEYADHRFTPEVFDIGDTAWVDVTLRNIGAMPSPPMSAQLISGRLVVNLFNDRADFDPVDIDDDEATARFRIHAHDLTVPGTNVEMTILLESEDGFRDTTSFSFTIGAPETDTPFGPDAYGYVCFDDTDREWPDVAPTYDWIEIDPQLDGPGTDTEIRDHGNEQDFTMLMDLPFDFRYYGEDFDQISICSNGWFSFGDQSKLADFQNRRIPPALGPRAQVCVFWDDLVNYIEDDEQIGGIFTYFDEENHRFIIEWSRMRRYIGMLDEDRIRPGRINTFQAILYDPQHHPTYTGDGDIVFQYHTMNNDRDVDPTEFDTPYATVGIVNLNGTDGMEYTFWNEYPAGAAILEDERAIKFSTKLIIVVGAVEGTVIDAETHNPIEGAEVRGSRGSYALTDEDGEYVMENVLIGEDYDFTAWAPGYNELVIEDRDIEPNETIELNFALTHPEFNLEQDTVYQNLAPGLDTQREVLLSNDGNGPLTFRSYFDYLSEEDGERWERLLNVNVTEVTNDTRIWGATFFNGYFWVTGSNNVRNPNYFYLFHRDGSLYRSIEQPGESSYGFRGMTVDAERGLLYGCEGNWIVGVDGNAIPRDSIPKPAGYQIALAYDSENDHFWIADGRSQLLEIDRNGETISAYRNHELNIMGLAYFADDPDGYPLYILSQDKINPALQVPYALVSRYNPETGEQQVVTVLEGVLEDRGGGIGIINTFDSHKWVMVSVLTNPNGDQFSVYDLGPNTTWVRYEPHFGVLEADRSIPLQFSLNAVGLEEGDYGLSVQFIHNAAGLETVVPILLNVNDRWDVNGDDAVPSDFGLYQNYPNPFNSATSISFSLPWASIAVLTVFDITGREIAVLMDQHLTSGRHRVDFDAADLPSGIYLIRLQADGQTALVKTALIR